MTTRSPQARGNERLLSRRRDRPAEPSYALVATALALFLHVGLGVALALQPSILRKKRTVVEVDIRKPPPPPPEAERKIEPRPQPRAETPRPTKAPKEPPKPVVPVFGLTDTVETGSVSVPLGNTTIADPSKRVKGPIEPLPPAQGAPGKEFHPVSELDLKAQPAHDADECFAGMNARYTESEARAQGVQGDIVFRIDLDERGKIVHMKTVKGLGHGLDEMAMGWLRFNPKCRFGAAIAKDGKPAQYTIDRYTIHFYID